jgi:hypothetical protein
MGMGGNSNYDSPDPSFNTVSISQAAAKQAAKTAMDYIGMDDSLLSSGGAASQPAMAEAYTDAQEVDRRKKSWEDMIAAIGSKYVG